MNYMNIMGYLTGCKIIDTAAGSSQLSSSETIVAKETEICIQSRDYGTAGGKYLNGDHCHYLIKVR